jgi:hypothetical protein
MTENVWEEDPEYAKVAEEYEENVLVAGVPEASLTFRCSVPTQGKHRCITPNFQQLLSLFAH